jgi:hypothetical protein
MEFALREEKANVKDMKLMMKQQTAELTVAQRETKTILRFKRALLLTQTPTLTLMLTQFTQGQQAG